MRNSSRWASCVAVSLLTSCGGGGSGGGSPVAAPAPTPSPTPAPTPTPTPITATARIYAASQATGVLEFTTGDIDTFGNYLALGFTSRDGRYFAGFANAIAGYTGIGTEPGANLTTDYASRFKRSDVFDHETGSRIIMNAPANLRMVTPVTSMLVAPGSTAAKLKTQLGINGSLFGMVNDPDLATFDAVSETESGDAARAAEGARMHAANVRVLAITTGLSAIVEANGFTRPGYNSVLGDIRDTNTPIEALTAKCLNSGPNQFIFQNDRMTQVVQCYASNFSFLQLSTTKAQAVAHLIDAYAAALPVRLESQNDKARWILGLSGYLRPLIGQLVSAQGDTLAQAALSITTPTILNETARYAEHYRYNETGLFNPAPDYFVLTGATSLSFSSSVLVANDVVFSNERFNTRGIDSSQGTIQSVSVPSANASQITVVAGASDSYTLTALSGFRGVSYFDYVSTARNGEQRTARAYVRVI